MIKDVKFSPGFYRSFHVFVRIWKTGENDGGDPPTHPADTVLVVTLNIACVVSSRCHATMGLTRISSKMQWNKSSLPERNLSEARLCHALPSYLPFSPAQVRGTRVRVQAHRPRQTTKSNVTPRTLRLSNSSMGHIWSQTSCRGYLTQLALFTSKNHSEEI